jgi:hypothetical protein
MTSEWSTGLETFKIRCNRCAAEFELPRSDCNGLFGAFIRFAQERGWYAYRPRPNMRGNAMRKMTPRWVHLCAEHAPKSRDG